MHIYFIKYNNLNTNTDQWTPLKRIQISQCKNVTWDQCDHTKTNIRCTSYIWHLSYINKYIKKQLQRANVRIKRWENKSSMVYPALRTDSVVLWAFTANCTTHANWNSPVSRCNRTTFSRFEVLNIFWYVMPCSLVYIYQHLRRNLLPPSSGHSYLFPLYGTINQLYIWNSN
jgi:hypothetical protein